MKLYLASIVSMIRAGITTLRGRSTWVDDGICTCNAQQLRSNTACPDQRPSEEPLSPLLRAYENELETKP